MYIFDQVTPAYTYLSDSYDLNWHNANICQLLDSPYPTSFIDLYFYHT